MFVFGDVVVVVLRAREALGAGVGGDEAEAGGGGWA